MFSKTPLKYRILLAVLLLLVVFGYLLSEVMGAGAFSRKFTWSGILSICKPDGYEVVCFLDADSKGSSPHCVPLSLAGGKCLK